MTASEKLMAQLMGYKSRKQFLQKVVELIPIETSTVLDIGCGVGLLNSIIDKQLPKASVIGMDMSWHMLTHQIDAPNINHYFLVQGIAPKIPFKEKSFDVVVAIQFLSEVLAFLGKEGFFNTIVQIKQVLKEGGVLIVLDHQNPGKGDIELKLSKKLMERLRLFQTLFQVRNINFEVLPNNWTRMTLRDLYDFLTKVWSFNTPLEEEEMQESHTPFTGEEFAALLKQKGFAVDFQGGVVKLENYLRRYKIVIRPKISLPNRFFLVSARTNLK